MFEVNDPERQTRLVWLLLVLFGVVISLIAWLRWVVTW